MDLPVRRLLRPRSIEETLALLADDTGARVVAGGTDLVVQLRDGRRRADTLVDLGALPLAGIQERDGGWHIGACTTMDVIARHQGVARSHPALVEAAGQVGAWPIQCRATIGGNLANASPAADTAPPLLVAEAAVEVTSRQGDRELSARELFLGPGQTALQPGELLVGVVLPPLPAGRVVERFLKLGPRREQAISMVCLAARAVLAADGSLEQVAVALGSVAPTPVRAVSVEEYLAGRRPDEEVRRQAVRALQRDIVPIDDVRAPARYRRVAAAVLLDRFLVGLNG